MAISRMDSLPKGGEAYVGSRAIWSEYFSHDVIDRPVAWTRDGEPGGLWQAVQLKNIQAPVRLIF